MKICLIDTTAQSSRRLIPHWMPLGPAYVAAALEAAGHHVSIIERDVIFRRSFLNAAKTDALTAGRLREFGPDLVGISAATELLGDALAAASIAAKVCPGAPRILGGHHACALPLATLEKCPDLDAVVVGEGEPTMLELAEKKPWSEIKGLAYRGDGGIIMNEPRPPISRIDTLPPPARHLLDMPFHTRPTHLVIKSIPLRTTTMLTSRGCPHGCRFCVESLPFGRSWRAHSTSRVMAEFEAILSRYDVQAIYFLDEGFLSDRRRAEELLEAMVKSSLPRRLSWAAQVRADSLDKDILRLMKEAGCLQVEVGFESGSDRLLTAAAKGTSRQRNEAVAALVRESGLRLSANIIVGLPGETEEEFRQTVAFALGLGADHVNLGRFTPHPGSAFSLDLEQRGMDLTRRWLEGSFNLDGFNASAMATDRYLALYRSASKMIMDRVNTPDRMKTTPLWRRLSMLSAAEIRYAFTRTPATAATYLGNWLKSKFRAAGDGAPPKPK